MLQKGDENLQECTIRIENIINYYQSEYKPGILETTAISEDYYY